MQPPEHEQLAAVAEEPAAQSGEDGILENAKILDIIINNPINHDSVTGRSSL
jgi:hypothetical protein